MIITEEVQDIIDELQKRNPEVLATALIFAISEILNDKQTDTAALFKEASEEALNLVNNVHMAQPRTKEVLH